MVEIDESKFVKRKYNKGKARKCEDWVLGGICRETGQVFMAKLYNGKATPRAQENESRACEAGPQQHYCVQMRINAYVYRCE